MQHHDGRLEVVTLSSTDWRVCDARIPESDASRLLAYVQQHDHRVELMRMRPVPGLCDWFASVEDALATIAAELPRDHALTA
ncbi:MULTISPECIES: hypothetical protein [Clavibacter]|uniref:Uncharacterized protein n=2 Tax=Clavibacter TaxID=1573 RepID=A0A399NQ72_9MICO|nr:MULTISPECIES: hypothetical protein [Clavibacter]KDP92165.1 hypothetical protein W824_04290 [Clavibacter cf. michiganensis LMG 26808]MBE3079503.1 hypothetical protein [Clavibacter michiganensis subsp. michiganensis]MBF4621842.1 hypothetical protein [Clavibacter sp. VKM Ac-2542]MBF4638170.1 hypothetical protein [Clavibacter michiganensis subsp. michiganensis]MDO4017083.1 hypothetical protein [Clavibacter michiganensis]